MADRVGMFIESLDMKESSRKTYARIVKEYIRYTESIGNPEPSRDVLLSFKRHLLDVGKSENTINTYIIVANAYYKWLAETGIISAYIPPIKGVKISAGAKRHESLTSAQAYAMLNTDAKIGKIGGRIAKARDEAIVMLSLYTGLREISIASLTFGDLRNKMGKTVLYYLSKGHYSKDAYVVIVPELASKIYAYLDMRGNVKDSDPLFLSTSNSHKNQAMSTQSIAKIIRSYLRMNGIKNPRITPHSLRATAGTFALLGGASVKECANMLNHADSTTTERYYLHDLTRIQGIGEEAVSSFIKSESEGIALGNGQVLALTEETQ